ncbi:MAG: hypothetical protein ABI559_04995 [Chloroflexota bacterium]
MQTLHVDCDNVIGTDDVLAILAFASGVDNAQDAGSACPAIVQSVVVEGDTQTWGDNNCASGVEGSDALADLLFSSLLTPSPNSNCPNVGDLVNVSGAP